MEIVFIDWVWFDRKINNCMVRCGLVMLIEVIYLWYNISGYCVYFEYINYNVEMFCECLGLRIKLSKL